MYIPSIWFLFLQSDALNSNKRSLVKAAATAAAVVFPIPGGPLRRHALAFKFIVA